MEENIFEKEFRALGTDVYIGIVAPKNENEKVLSSFSEVENICGEKESILSRFDLKSELSKLNNDLGHFMKLVMIFFIWRKNH